MGQPIDITGQLPVPGPTIDITGEEPETETGATPVAESGGQQEEQEGFHDPYADEDAELPRHVVVRINGVTMQHLASSFMGSILSLLLVFVEMVFFYGQCFTQ